MDYNSFKIEFLDGVLGLNSVESLNCFVADFLVEKLKLSNCSIYCMSRKHRKVDNYSLEQIYDGVERVLNEHILSMRTFFVSESVVNDLVFDSIKGRDVIPQHLVAVPLLSDCVFGFVVCYADDKVSSLLEFLSWLSSRLVIVLERIKRHDEIKQSAIHDSLTGLHNRVFLEIVGEQCISRLYAEGLPCALFLFDIDNFKSYNDQNGHVAGDNILKELGDLLSSFFDNANSLQHMSSRNLEIGPQQAVKYSTQFQDKNFLVSRYGGEEFVVLLPEVKNDVCLDIAEKLKVTVAERVGITISVGIVCCLNSSVNLQRMVQEADIALYKAKSLGKNCCVQRIIVDKNVNVIDANDANSLGKTIT